MPPRLRNKNDRKKCLPEPLKTPSEALCRGDTGRKTKTGISYSKKAKNTSCGLFLRFCGRGIVNLPKSRIGLLII
jgi:hypothetical protein